MFGQEQDEEKHKSIRAIMMDAQRLKKGDFSLKTWFITLLAVALAGTACQFRQPTPRLEWDTSPGAKLIVVQNPIRFPGILSTYQDERMQNYIPDGVLYGDGRILWVAYIEDNGIASRRVLEGSLTPAEITALLEQFMDTGFFTWKDSYGSTIQNDSPPNESIYVFLDTLTKGVIVDGNPPQGFEGLRTLVSTGAGARGQDYLPERGYLSVYPLSFDQSTRPQMPRWPATEADFSLKDLYGEGGLENGIYIEGQELAFAWQIINRDPRNPLVEDGGEVYYLTLRIPNLSPHQPPDPQDCAMKGIEDKG